MTATMTKKASRVDYHTAEWIERAGVDAALMKFNGATGEQVKASIWKDFPAGEVEYEAYLDMARIAYRRMWSELAPHVGQGFVARMTWENELAFAPADRLAEIPDAGWNWVKELRGV
jgi:hypothetical protein